MVQHADAEFWYRAVMKVADHHYLLSWDDLRYVRLSQERKDEGDLPGDGWV